MRSRAGNAVALAMLAATMAGPQSAAQSLGPAPYEPPEHLKPGRKLDPRRVAAAEAKRERRRARNLAALEPQP